MKNIVLLTGAGISAESGIKTFRDADGLWEGHDVMQVASPQGFAADPELVLDFYNQRRKQLLTVKPNKAHLAITKLQEHFNVTVITQNVDDLHERAGNKNVVHLHGELLKVRCTKNENEVLEWKKDLVLGNLSSTNKQLRPHIVWFGEEVPLLQKAAEITKTADILIIIGTSMQVYPAAGLVHYANNGTPIYFIDPNPSIKQSDFNSLTIINKTAVNGLPTLVSTLIDTEL
ncbi:MULTISPECIES: SIR2 family NAD-dependent protein deacylase [unclassified Cellulophaga]|uniref:SIR2 family NAD-dependent protein deacylase n=1 Tax=unclassified Cellulophaga TaxID=2634405 RepID=UPI0026E458F0|nr:MULTISPECIES: NAD-dependent deacylase [unclassified Cellulophaga]MDO6492137.1 NAD-dependent deacylase [Cellulophaga sp. 2_MG-2023]MDO6495702.1 NAD-dependent deacylase [Cellulophaga sp. 3_MG-2023]